MEDRRKEKIVVTVRYGEDTAGAFLTIDPERLELTDHQWVVWTFVDVPAHLHFVASLLFARPLGPFHILRTAPNLRAVVGKGNAGEAEGGAHTYHATIVYGEPGNAQIVSSRSAATIDNKAERIDTTPEVRVRYIPGKDGGKGVLVADPHVVYLNDGDSPLWTFDDLPAGGSIYLYATAGPQGAAHPWIGPFQSLTSLRTGGPSAASQCVVGSGQGFSAPGRYTYHLELVGADGKSLAGGDPIIDNGGPPA